MDVSKPPVMLVSSTPAVFVEIPFNTEIMECISDAYIAYDLEWHFVHMNISAEKILQCRRSEVIGQKLWDVFPFLLGTHIEAAFKKAVETKEPQFFEMVYEPQDAIYAVRAHLVGDILAVFFQEVTDYRNKKERADMQENVRALRASQEQLAMAVKSARVGFYDWDLLSDRIVMSDQLYEDLGLDRETFLANSTSVCELIHPEDRACIVKKIERALLGVEVYEVEYRLISRRGHTVWMAVRGEVVFSSTGRPLRFFGSAVNITEQRRIQDELEQARVNAEKASSSKSAFLASMSHEIRTPLDAILGFADLLRFAEVTNEERQQYLEIISRSGRSLARIIDDILDLSKVEAGKMRIELAEFSLSELIEDVLRMFQDRVRNKKIELKFDPVGCPTELLVSDPARLRQILVNLVGNAIKFTSHGGVTLSVEVTPLGSFKRHVTILVKDTGTGLNTEQVQRLFQPFVQVNQPNRKFGGTGLGLMLSRKLARVLGGDVNVRSHSEGQGCVFAAEIVADVRAADLKEVSQNLNGAMSKSDFEGQRILEGLKILLVDDSSDNRTLMKILLKREGAISDEATNGQEAVERALQGQYDVVLMDIQMPGMDGFDALASLRKNFYRKPIIALTAHALEEERQKTLKAGFNDHVTKPVNREALVSAILQQVRRH